jgi:hypothetical protein
VVTSEIDTGMQFPVYGGDPVDDPAENPVDDPAENPVDDPAENPVDIPIDIPIYRFPYRYPGLQPSR